VDALEYDMPPLFLNQAGTSWPKPQPVVDAMTRFMPALPIEWPMIYSDAHQRVADFFGVPASRLVLTGSCTSALSLAVSDHNWQVGDRVVTSHFEHHALYRNLEQLRRRGVEVVVTPFTNTTIFDLELFERELMQGGVRMVAVTAACNVTGRRLPIETIIRLAHEYQALVLIDGAQISGWIRLDVSQLGADLFTFAGHKAMHGPWGIGGLYVAPNVALNSPMATCDPVADPTAETNCQRMPGFCDAGSVNLMALSGLAASCDWLDTCTSPARLTHTVGLARQLSENLSELPGITLYHQGSDEEMLPSVAFTIAGISPAAVAARLREQALIVSGGFQCSPQTHIALGTSDEGVIRISLGVQQTVDDVELACAVLESSLQSLRQEFN